MKRFRELIAAVREKHSSDTFFADFESSCLREPLKRKHYRCYNDALMLLDDESWNILKEKAIEHFMDEREGQRKQGFFNQLNEAFAYRNLLRRGMENVRFVKEVNVKRPDISFLDRGREGYCEVKTIGISDVEIKRRDTAGVQDGNIYFNLNDGFLKQLAVNVETAWKQIHSLGENGLVFILIRFDDIALHHRKTYKKQLTEFCRSRGFENLAIKIDHRGNRGIGIKPSIRSRHLVADADSRD